MKSIIDYIGSLFTSDAYRLWAVALEMLLIGVVVYSVLRFLHGTRGARLLQGLLMLVVGGFLTVHVLADKFGLERIAVLYQPFVWTVLVTTLIVFQPELRRGLMQLGETRFRRPRQSELDRVAKPIAAACAQLSKNKIGALIAIERDIGLAATVDQGVRLDARLSPELLNTIFWPGSALHDLGVVIQHGRVAAAGCPFPLADADGLDRSIGSRHRAALGMSLDSDAVVVVVSEETGAISIAERGKLSRHIPPDALLSTLKRHLASERGITSTRTPVAAPAEDDQESPTGATPIETVPAEPESRSRQEPVEAAL